MAEAIGAPRGLIEALDALHVPDVRLPSATPTAPRGGASSAPSRADATPAAHPDRHDDASVIRNAAQLTADDVAMRRVLCPACEEKVFETWPGGWDAHAAHVCRGITAGTEAERKAEYRRRFAHLFRDDGAIASPSRQRDVMRRIWGVYGPDEERVIREYAAAERRGEVARARNRNDMAAEDYARALLADARQKGWLKGYPPEAR